ncbi:phosphonate C-P lyase system protein PhnG [Nocardia sp. NPDC059239]|uniref:phosphonate C-P lyase system protein PhnG n=1 Tax=Nocardia sp. NPDC059239 TaxID=3346785 RepID=UPI0036817313
MTFSPNYAAQPPHSGPHATTVNTDTDRDTLVGLFARADRDHLIEAADAVLADYAAAKLQGPQLGTVLFQVREPIEHRRFYLGDVLVTEARVRIADNEGWAMRLGDDPEATVAAAVCDAALQFENPHHPRLVALCASTDREIRARRQGELDEIEETAVKFEELGG